MRILAVDPGEKRLGLALSDPTGSIASPLLILQHTARAVDAAAIASLAQEHAAALILVGQALGDDGQSTPSSRRADRLAEALRQQTSIPVLLWDESGSTQAALHARHRMGLSRKKRLEHLDDVAAVVILQSYLDSRSFSVS